MNYYIQKFLKHYNIHKRQKVIGGIKNGKKIFFLITFCFCLSSLNSAGWDAQACMIMDEMHKLRKQKDILKGQIFRLLFSQEESSEKFRNFINLDEEYEQLFVELLESINEGTKEKRKESGCGCPLL